MKNSNLYNLNDFYLCKYISVSDLEKCFTKDKFSVLFTKIAVLEDCMEGWNLNIPHLKLALIVNDNYIDRVLNENGTIEPTISVIKTISDLMAMGDSKLKRIDIGNILKETKSYLERINKNYVSCWFLSDNEIVESRYMWDIYGRKNIKTLNNKLGVMFAVKWSELQKSLDKSKISFKFGFIDYDNNNDDFVFTKDSSYAHEKEFRIIIENIGESERIPILIDIPKNIKCILDPNFWEKSISPEIRSVVSELRKNPDITIQNSSLFPDYILKRPVELNEHITKELERYLANQNKQ